MLVKIISAEQTYDVRRKVLRENIPLPYEFNGDLDKDTLHIGAVLEGEILGVASFMKAQLEGFEGTHYQLRGMATLKEHQGKGLGNALLNKAEKLLMVLGCDFIWCNARIVALRFYKKNGYKVVGSEFDIKYIGPHYKMWKKI